MIFTIDALRADHLGCYGYPRATTPRIDELAKQGVLFEQAVTQWPKTGPSMASLMTSTYGSTSGVARTTLDKKIPVSYELLAETLHAAGWETMGVVSNLSLAPTFHFEQGFDRYVVERENNYADHVAASARGLLEKRDRAKPYFLWVHFLDPHAPYKPPPRYSKEFLADEHYQRDERPSIPVDPRLKDPAAKVEKELGLIPGYAYLPGRDRLRDYVAEYDGDIRFMDDQLGALMDWMRARGDLEQTLLVFTADHGEALGEHDYYFEHGKLPYDDCVRVPLIVVHPGWQPARVTSPVGLIDLAPTILESLGLAPGWQTQGRSLLEWVATGAPETQARPVFTESGYVKEFEVSIRKGRFKLIKIGTRYLSKLLTGAPYELYDVIADPGETKNLVDEQPELFAEMREELDAYVETAYQRVPPPTEGEDHPLSPDEQKAMIELGYAHDKEHAEQGDKHDDEKDGGGK